MSKRLQELDALHQQQAESEAAQVAAEEALEREKVGKKLNQDMLQAVEQSSMDTLSEVWGARNNCVS